MARLVLDHGLAATSTGGFRPHLSVTVTLESLVAQVNALASTQRAEQGARGAAAFPTLPPGWDAAVLADGTPIPATVLARLACDGEVTRVVFGPEGQVLDVGRAERLYTGAMRRAVIARDRHCAYPGCTRPPTFGEIHHIRHWAAHRGETSVSNGVLLCWHHHDVVHSRHLIIHRNHTRARWDVTEADGTPIPHPGDRTEQAGRPHTRSTRGARRDGPEPEPEPDRAHEPDREREHEHEHDRRRGAEPMGSGLPPDRSALPESRADHERGLHPDRRPLQGRGPRDDLPNRDADPPPASLFDDVA